MVRKGNCSRPAASGEMLMYVIYMYFTIMGPLLFRRTYSVCWLVNWPDGSPPDFRNPFCQHSHNHGRAGQSPYGFSRAFRNDYNSTRTHNTRIITLKLCSAQIKVLLTIRITPGVHSTRHQHWAYIRPVIKNHSHHDTLLARPKAHEPYRIGSDQDE